MCGLSVAGVLSRALYESFHFPSLHGSLAGRALGLGGWREVIVTMELDRVKGISLS
jgi:hypothetical protein